MAARASFVKYKSWMSPQADHTSSPRIAVVGAGWAGLAAAWKLKQAGWHTEIFEQAPVLGGRARKALIPRRNLILDNGQHLMLGAYQQILALMQEIGIDLDEALLRLPLQLTTLNRQFGLRVNRAYPSPLRLPLALLRLNGLTAREKLSLVSALFRLQLTGWQVKPELTVQAWLNTQSQSPTLIQLFWAPLCIATLNTPVAEASMALFAGVLKDSLGAGADACDLILPRVDLSALWPEALARQLTVHTNSPVRSITRTSDGYMLQIGLRENSDEQTQYTNGGSTAAFDAVILAAPPLICHRLLARLAQDHAHHAVDTISSSAMIHEAAKPVTEGLASLPEPNPNPIASLLQQLQSFQYHAIATLTVFLAAPFPLPDCMYMLVENRDLGYDGQWLFNRSRFMQPSASREASVTPADAANASAANEQTPAPDDEHRHAISIVISHADHLAGTDKNRIADAVLAQIRSQLPEGVLLPAVLGHELIIEKRATFAATPQLMRPGNTTPWPGLFLAGDWTDTGYPAVLEGAVISGIDAAQAVRTSFENKAAANATIRS